MLICLCRSNPNHNVRSGSRTLHPENIPLPNVHFDMACIKTGAPAMAGDELYGRNCDIFMCPKCGARIANI